MAVLAEGDAPTGEHWVLRAGGTSSNFYTFLQTVHPDGYRDSGGMGGPILPPGSLMNTYTGTSERGTRRVLVRADSRVARVRVKLGSGGHLDLSPAAARPDLGLVLFATLLPPGEAMLSVTAISENGHALEPQDLSRHEAGRQHGLPGDQSAD
jgi:hypothetical protein